MPNARAKATRHVPVRSAAPGERRGAPAHVEDLGALDEQRLEALLELRPDLADPAPPSIDDLEVRALSVPSVQRVLLQADRSVLQLAQVFTILGEKHVRVAGVCRLVGPGAEPEVHRALEWLAARQLVSVVGDDELCVHPALLAIVGAGALGPPAAQLVERLTVGDLETILRAVGRWSASRRKAELVGALVGFLSDAAAVSSLVDAAPSEARALARSLSASSRPLTLPWPLAADPYRRSASGAAAWLLQHGLVYRETWATASMPREVGLALRGGHPFAPGSYRRPVLDLAPLADPPAPAVEARAAALVTVVERIVECWGSRPAAVLKSGGVGVREVRRLAADLEVPERDAFRLVEVAAAGGLVVEDPRQGMVLPTPAADHWLELTSADRWWALARAWLAATVPASLAGAVDVRGKVVPALAGGSRSRAVPEQRRTVLRLVLELRHGRLDAAAALAEVATWGAPLAWSEAVAPPSLAVEWTLSEMELLGLVVGGSPSPLAAALLHGDAEAARRALASPEAEAWEMVLQADLTALATGRVPAPVRAELGLLADVESRGSATVYRFSEASVRRAFDAGRTATEILAFLATHAGKGVPQALEYLVGDVDRRHGHIRLGAAGCYVRFDDAALATEVHRSKKAGKLGLRQIAPTVLVSDRPPHAVLSALRGLGYLPVAEAEDGSVVRTSVAPQRAAPAQRAPGPPVRAGDERARTEGGWDRAGPPGPAGVSPEAGVGAGAASRRELVARLLRSPRGASTPTGRRRGAPPWPGQVPRVEIPTVLRRPDEPDGVPGQGPEALWDEVPGASLLASPGFGRSGLPGASSAGGLDDALGLEDEDLDDFDDLLVGTGGGAGTGGGGGEEEWHEGRHRPSEIVRAPDAVRELLVLAAEEEWLVRISYTSGAGKSFEATVSILDVSGGVMVALAAPRWAEQKYVLARIGWVRVLTEAEEDRIQ